MSKELERPPPLVEAQPTVIVSFRDDEQDLDNPLNWSKKRKWLITAVVFYNFLVVGFNSSIITTDFEGVGAVFHRPQMASIMTFFVFVIGFSVAPMVFSPLSESYGRRKVYRCTLLPAVIVIIPCALATDYAMLIVFRFIDGFLFGAPLTLCGATIADIWTKKERGLYLMYFTAAPLVGLVAGPLIGGFIGKTWSWRALYWAQAMGSFFAVLTMWFVPETYAPKILEDRAKWMGSQDPTRKYVTADHNDEHQTLKARLATQLKTPFKMLRREWILNSMAMFVALLFGETYILFISLPYIFMEGSGFSRVQTGICFAPAGLGIICGVLPSAPINKWYRNSCKQYERKRVAAQEIDLERNQSVNSDIEKIPETPSPRPTRASVIFTASQPALRHYPPELRLKPMLFCSPIIPLSLLILSFIPIPQPSPFPNHTLWLPAVALFLFGFAIVIVLNSANAYIADCYSEHVASAFAGVTMIRGVLGAACILFTRSVYEGLGIRYATWVLSGIAFVGCFVPALFRWKGRQIRARSPWCWKEDS